MDSKPNLFDYATSELSQDAFFLWLCEWADENYKDVDNGLHTCARGFIKELLFNKEHPLNEEIKTVKTFKQQCNVDISLLVNDKYYIIIEDKLFTKEHSNQLTRYKESAEKHCGDKKYEEPICVYLKTTYQSKSSLKDMSDNGWKPVMRKDLVEFFRKYDSSINNNIFSDYVNHLYNKDSKFLSYKAAEIKDWNYNSWVGFYEELENELVKRNLIEKSSLVDWRYVNNASGGFLGFWWHWIGLTDNSYIYLQIEQRKLCVRLDVAYEEDEDWQTIRNKIRKIVEEKAKEEKYKDDLRIIQYNLRFANSGYMTIGSTDPTNWLGTDAFDMNSVIERLRKYMGFIEECSKEYKAR